MSSLEIITTVPLNDEEILAHVEELFYSQRPDLQSDESINVCAQIKLNQFVVTTTGNLFFVPVKFIFYNRDSFLNIPV